MSHGKVPFSEDGLGFTSSIFFCYSYFVWWMNVVSWSQWLNSRSFRRFPPQKFSFYFIPLYIVLLTCNLSTFFLLHLHLLRSTCQLLSTWLFHHKRSISSFQCYWTWLSQVSGIIYRHNVTCLVTLNRKICPFVGKVVHE